MAMSKEVRRSKENGRPKIHESNPTRPIEKLEYNILIFLFTQDISPSWGGFILLVTSLALFLRCLRIGSSTSSFLVTFDLLQAEEFLPIQLV